MTEPLDNPIWHALTGPQAAWALRHKGAVRFLPEAAPFFAMDRVSDDHLRDLAGLVRRAPTAHLGASPHAPAPSAAEARLFLETAIAAPPGWTKTFEKPLAQMVLPDPARVRTAAELVVELGPEDTADILDLARRAEPGPFGSRTPELGTFVGIRCQGRLVGMAGERLRLPGYTEISAVATDAGYRGRGLGAALTLGLAARIQARGAVPFLHVFEDNPAAGLYRKLGFAPRRALVVTWLRLDSP